MGSTGSKAAQKLPRRPEVPLWNVPRPGALPSKDGHRQRPLASEKKDEMITEDAKDPDFMANLTRLGPVKVNQSSQVVRTANVEKSRQLLKSRIRADQEASAVRNRVSASTLSFLLDQRKSAKTIGDVEALISKYGIDWAKTIGKDGEENVTVLAVWVEPSLSS
ncbi:hypothetical protein E1B28_008656 [Marasmius oreades]|uniref:Uncharacterized protein n=1 Tax=Marasmius oreades TaxID=181124 RepID=A0A9P7RYY4_9AGAR|nr:uncharacterized protein E1B28_008656 [Marasmius oreades]KAG7092294.1 hypothetical protein E1B28_008656 [Marasmius oreades]